MLKRRWFGDKHLAYKAIISIMERQLLNEFINTKYIVTILLTATTGIVGGYASCM